MTKTAVKSMATDSRKNLASDLVTLRRQIGSTVFVVNIHFSNTSKEPMQDKLLRLMESEVRKSA